MIATPPYPCIPMPRPSLPPPALTTHDREPSRSRMQSAFSWHGLGVPSGQKRSERRLQPDVWSPTKPGWQGPHWKEPWARTAGSELGLPATSHPPRVSILSTPPGPYPGVDAHGVGDTVMLPGLTLVNVRANLDGRECRGHRPHAQNPQTSLPVHVSSASYVSPSFLPQPQPS